MDADFDILEYIKKFFQVSHQFILKTQQRAEQKKLSKKLQFS